jgi:protein ImuB
MKRIVSLWLPLLATDRLCRTAPGQYGRDRPLATATGGERRLVVAVNRAARAAGVRPGVSAADAQATAPDLRLVPADPAADRALLARLADWCVRYTPWTAVDDWVEDGKGGGLWLDISGCAHLFGGEDALLADLTARLGRCGFTARAAVADTPGAAWAWARFGAVDRRCLAPGGQRPDLAGLSVAALRLLPATAAGLVQLGLRRIGELAGVPRAALAARFGPIVGQRVDQALGDVDEPISPRRPPPVHQVQLAFAEPVARPEDIAAAARHLLDRLAVDLERQRVGVRRLALAAFRLDASVQCLAVGTSAACRDPAHLARLLALPLAGLDAGFGIERIHLAAVEVGPMEAAQIGLVFSANRQDPAEARRRLFDSLGNRLGFERILRFAPRSSHLPERAVRRVDVSTPLSLPEREGGPRRPLRLFRRPEAVEAMAPVPDAPPLLFRWRRQTHRVAHAAGPERLSAEWWRAPAADRDYYCVEDQSGRRFWLYREGHYGDSAPPRWFVHGIFA